MPLIKLAPVSFDLAPVAFDPDPSIATAIPVAGDPTGVGVGWFDVITGDPYVLVAVPTVIAFVPGPAGVLVGWRRDYFNGAWWRRTDANDDLGLRDAGGEKERAGDSGE
jgi:hypothetical protein